MHYRAILIHPDKTQSPTGESRSLKGAIKSAKDYNETLYPANRIFVVFKSIRKTTAPHSYTLGCTYETSYPAFTPIVAGVCSIPYNILEDPEFWEKNASLLDPKLPHCKPENKWPTLQRLALLELGATTEIKDGQYVMHAFGKTGIGVSMAAAFQNHHQAAESSAEPGITI